MRNISLVLPGILVVICAIHAVAEDWTVNGKFYHDVKVTKVDDNKVHITFEGGIGSVPLTDLPPYLKEKFNFDPKKASVADQIEADKAAQAGSQIAAQISKARAEDGKEQRASLNKTYLASGFVIQVLPDGILTSLLLKEGQLDRCFVQCSSKGMIDGQSWSYKIVPAGTYSYTDVLGTRDTVAKFSTDLSAEETPLPQLHTYPPRPTSSLGSVGGGN